MEFLKVGQRNSKPIIAIKDLSINLCKFLGAFAADGSLDHKSRINISDGDLRELKKVQEWFYNLFGIKGIIRKAKKGNWFEFEIYNKTVGRYLNTIFEFPIGKKSLIVDEPKIIKNSNLKFRKAFAAGVLNFDGSVTIYGNITLESHSPLLINSIEEILKLDKIKNHKSSDCRIISISRPSLKCLDYFEEGTDKRKRLEIILGIRKELIMNTTMEKVLKVIGKIKIFNLKMLASKMNLNVNSLCAYTKILKNCSVIRLINEYSKILEHFQSSDGIYVILEDEKRNELFLGLLKLFRCNNFNELCSKLKISSRSMCRWRLGQNGIPIKLLVKFYELLNWKLDKNEVSQLRVNHNCKFYEIDSTTFPPGSVSLKT